MQTAAKEDPELYEELKRLEQKYEDIRDIHKRMNQKKLL